MKELKKEIEKLLRKTKGDMDIIKEIKCAKALFPFSTESNLLAYFMSIGELSYEELFALATSYSQRNKYLEL